MATSTAYDVARHEYTSTITILCALNTLGAPAAGTQYPPSLVYCDCRQLRTRAGSIILWPKQCLRGVRCNQTTPPWPALTQLEKWVVKGMSIGGSGCPHMAGVRHAGADTTLHWPLLQKQITGAVGYEQPCVLHCCPASVPGSVALKYCCPACSPAASLLL
jgi:hypothetical protein